MGDPVQSVNARINIWKWSYAEEFFRDVQSREVTLHVQVGFAVAVADVKIVGIIDDRLFPDLETERG